MAEERVQRRLATILAADVVGYSRLMEADEAGTLAALKLHQAALIDPTIAEYQGRIVKLMGDGVLVEFPSVVNAVECAVRIQRCMLERNADIPDSQEITFRIGINLGDVIIDGDDIYGDGVNVAARLEGLAEPGGLCISDVVHQSVIGKLDLAFEDLGEQTVKNIDRPVRCYRMLSDPSGDARNNLPDIDHSPELPDRLAVAVLPFENMSGDAEQDYFADGLTEDIITALSLWKSFPVIARNSTFAYKGQSPDVREVGKTLGARYVVEGSVRKSGSRVRVTVQLIDADTGHHVWAERYDRELAEIFELQDELTQQIAATIVPELERTEQKRAVEKKPQNLDAWDHVQRGFACLYEFSKSGNARAREMFEQALELDPAYSAAFVGVAWSHIRDLDHGSGEIRNTTIGNGLDAALQAVKFDQSNSVAHMVLGVLYLWSGQYNMMVPEFEHAIELNPYNAIAHVSVGHGLTILGRPNDGIPYIEKGLSLNPQDLRNYVFYTFLSQAHLLARRYDKAEEWARKAIRWSPDHPLPHLVRATGLGHLGRVDEARAELDACERIRPGYTSNANNWLSLKNSADNEHFLEGLRKAGWEG
ncbi:MAG: hypothetical protein HQ511_06905 [Rhodospirillales bacterium]|nr:hypothetical protein [Rhodospirillales bacterium]